MGIAEFHGVPSFGRPGPPLAMRQNTKLSVSCAMVPLSVKSAGAGLNPAQVAGAVQQVAVTRQAVLVIDAAAFLVVILELALRAQRVVQPCERDGLAAERDRRRVAPMDRAQVRWRIDGWAHGAKLCTTKPKHEQRHEHEER